MLSWLTIRRKGPAECSESRFAPAGDAQVSEHGQGSVIFRLSNGQFFVTNRAGSRMWRDLARGDSVTAITHELQRDYGIAFALAQKDVQEFVDELLRRKINQAAAPTACAPLPAAHLCDCSFRVSTIRS